MFKVAQIIPYFGKWPEWIDLYLYSCSRNLMIDFIFYTDCSIPTHCSDNIRFISISLTDYCQLVSDRLGIKYYITNPYKLTDLKPFMGAVHEKELVSYDFWGFGDLDLIYGDLSLVVNEENLRRYDLLTTHNYHIAGHFTLCRNNDYYRLLCFKIKEWQNRLVDTQHYGFDEAEWSHLVYPQMINVRRVYDYICKPLGVKFNSYMEIANKLVAYRRLFSEFHTTPAPQKGEMCRYDTESGLVFNSKGVQLVYLHFLFFKKTPFYKTDNYWREGYYKLDSDIDKYESVFFDVNGITGKEKI